MNEKGYPAVHTAFSVYLVQQGYRKAHASKRGARAQAAPTYDRTFEVTTEPENGTIVRRRRVQRTVKLVIYRKVPTSAQQVEGWQAALIGEVDTVAAGLWDYILRYPVAGAAVFVNEMAYTVAPEREKEGNYYRMELTVPVRYSVQE